MSRVLITGHSGYIGSKIYDTLKNNGHEVLGIDIAESSPKDISTYLKEDTDGKFHPYFWNFKPEYIFHLACFARVQYSVEQPVRTMENNVLATSHILNFARKVGTKRVIYSGSSAVLGNGSGPTSPYGLQKLISEMECKLYSDLYGLDTVSLRYFNVYSPCQPVDGPYATAIANWMHAIRNGKNPYITGTGNQRRDLVHLDDVVSANMFAMNYSEDFGGANLDVGTGNNISLNEIRDIVLGCCPHVEFDYVEDRPGDVFSTMADISSLRNLGWSSLIASDDGIQSCFRGLAHEI